MASLLRSAIFKKPSPRQFSSSAIVCKRVKVELTPEQQNLPRWQRRAIQFHQDERLQAGYQLTKEQRRREKREQRGKTAVKIKPKVSMEPPLLEPYVLAGRLSKLCAENNIDKAVDLLKNSPLDAQNAPTWNTLIWECMCAGRYSLAYKLYTDMKRRGFSPTLRTFLTMFRGWSRIGKHKWAAHTLQLAHARTTHQTYLRYIASLAAHEPHSENISSKPLAPYISILADSGNFQEAFAAFVEMPRPLRPDLLVFTAVLDALAKAGEQNASPGSLNPRVNLLDASSVWEQVVTASKDKTGHDFPIDSHLVTSALNAMAMGQPNDHNLGFSLASQYYGFPFPQPIPPSDQFKLSPPSLSAILSLCTRSGRAQEGIDFFSTIQRSVELARVVDRGHIQQMLDLHAKIIGTPPASDDALVSTEKQTNPNDASCALNLIKWSLEQEVLQRKGSKLLPNHLTYIKAFKICATTKDWKTSTSLFNLMTGYSMHEFADGVTRAPTLRRAQRSAGRNIEPDPELYSYMLETAHGSGNLASMRQALRLVETLGISTLQKELVSRRQIKAFSFSATKIAEIGGKVIDQVITTGPSNTSEEAARWYKLAGILHKIARSYQTVAERKTKASPDEPVRVGHEARRIAQSQRGVANEMARRPRRAYEGQNQRPTIARDARPVGMDAISKALERQRQSPG